MTIDSQKEHEYETNLYLYDEKHQNIINEMKLDYNKHPLALLEDVFEFLRQHNILTKYGEVCIADNVEVEYNDGERELRFSDKEKEI